MKFLANENVPRDSIHILRTRGYDISSIGEDNPSVTDEEVIQIAVKEERVIITFDRDYGELVFRKGMRPPQGIIYLRFEPVGPDEPAEILEPIINSPALKFSNCLTVVDRTFIRQRQY